MKEAIKLWKEYIDDQKARNKVMINDPDYANLFTTLDYRIADLVFKHNEMILKNKYGIEEETIENFMNWLANDKPLFKGVEIKHEVKL